MIVAVITGDIIHSRKVKPAIWLPLLEEALQKYGLKNKKWKIYRGDSFQLEVEISKLFEAIFYIKSNIKAQKLLDVRMSIGIGEKTHKGKDIMTSNGTAYIYSGEAFENLKKQTILIKTCWDELDEQLNLILGLAVSIVEKWNPNISKTVVSALNNSNLTQSELAEKLDKKQSQISHELRKANYEEIQKTIYYCTKILSAKC